MHKGTITMLGRSMAGSHAVIAHHEAGQALLVTYDPPDLQVPQVLVAYGHKVALAIGTSLWVIDRAVKAVAVAGAFDHQGWGVLCRLFTAGPSPSLAGRPAAAEGRDPQRARLPARCGAVRHLRW